MAGIASGIGALLGSGALAVPPALGTAGAVGSTAPTAGGSGFMNMLMKLLKSSQFNLDTGKGFKLQVGDENREVNDLIKKLLQAQGGGGGGIPGTLDKQTIGGRKNPNVNTPTVVSPFSTPGPPMFLSPGSPGIPGGLFGPFGQ